MKKNKRKKNLKIFIQNRTSKNHTNLITTEHGVSVQKVYAPQSPSEELIMCA